jgi:hypothetical protein
MRVAPTDLGKSGEHLMSPTYSNHTVDSSSTVHSMLSTNIQLRYQLKFLLQVNLKFTILRFAGPSRAEVQQ